MGQWGTVYLVIENLFIFVNILNILHITFHVEYRKKTKNRCYCHNVQFTWQILCSLILNVWNFICRKTWYTFINLVLKHNSCYRSCKGMQFFHTGIVPSPFSNHLKITIIILVKLKFDFHNKCIEYLGQYEFNSKVATFILVDDVVNRCRFSGQWGVCMT